MQRLGIGFLGGLSILLLLLGGSVLAASPVSITILHTNDLHAHFRPEKTPLALGGIARLKTMVDRLKATTPNPIFVDGGDWSEGDIYYTQGTGAAVLEMMNSLGYDITVVGNHDWLNGPDYLLDSIEVAKPKFSMVVANFDTSAYPRAAEWNQDIKPYVIRDIGGAKVAFIGLATYEFIYDSFIAPIKITDPISLTAQLARQLKQSVDAVVVISHNRISYNQALLKAAPDVDLVIGAHDHVKLTKPVIVTRPGANPGWIVETGCWGEYLGRVDMQVTPKTASAPSQVKLLNYGLIQLDRSVPEDPGIDAQLTTLEQQIAGRMGPVFTDHIADTDVELSRQGNESEMGNFTADAYRALTGTDIALDLKYFVYDQIHQGAINSVDVYNSNPAIFNPITGKTWTLKTLPMTGSTISWVLNTLLFQHLPISGALYTSGIDVLFSGTPQLPNPTDTGDVPADDFIPFTSPLSSMGADFTAGLGSIDDSIGSSISGGGTIRDISVGGEALQGDKTYSVAIGGGLYLAVEMLNSLLPNLVPTAGLVDTGIPAWQAMAEYAKQITPIEADKVPIGGRLETVQPDLGIYYDDVNWAPIQASAQGVTAKITVQVHNFGGTASPASGPYLLIAQNSNGNDLSTDAAYAPLAPSVPIESLEPGQSRIYSFTVTLKADRGIYGLTAMIAGNPDESNHTNDDVIRYFELPNPAAQSQAPAQASIAR